MGAFQRWFRRSFVGLTTGAMLAALVPPLPAVAAAHSDADLFAEQIATTLAGALDGLADLEDLQANVPLTTSSPSELLGLNGGLFSSALGTIDDPVPGAYMDVSDLVSALEGLSVPGVLNVEATDMTATDALRVGLDVTVTHSIDVPLLFDGDVVDLAGGVAPVDVELSLQGLMLRYDADAVTPADVFGVEGEPTLDIDVATGAVDAAAAATVDQFESLVGLADVTVDGSVLYDIGFDVAFQDPDADGLLDIDELSATAASDLFQLTVPAPSGQAVDIALSLGYDGAIDTVADLTGTLSLTLAELVADPLSHVQVDLGALDAFTQVSADELLSGLGLLASSLVGAEGLAPRLPFLDNALGQARTVADELLEFVRQQGVAVVMCGGSDGLPPFGDPGTGPLYCRAVTTEEPVDVTWTDERTSPSGTIANADVLSTVGPSPSTSAEYSDPAADVAVTFEFADGTTHTARPRFGSVQDLQQLLIDRLGMAAGDIGLAFDESTRSLSFAVTHTAPATSLSTASGDDVEVDVGDQLAAESGLTGLDERSAAGAAASFTVGESSLAVGFGVILTEDVADITPGDNSAQTPGLEDRFFLTAGPGGDLFTVADIGAEGTIALRGSLGFLEVNVDGAAGENPLGTSSALLIQRSDAGEPALRVGLEPGVASGVDVATDAGTATVADAVQLRDLLDGLASNVTLDCNVAAGLGLTVSVAGDVVVAGATGEGTVTANWPDVFPADCVPDTSGLIVDTEADFDTTLMEFKTDNPLALMSQILDVIDEVANRLGSQDALEQDLPVIGVTPRELMVKIHELDSLLDEIRTGEPVATIVCGDTAPTSSGRPPTGDVTGFEDPTDLYCQVRSAAASGTVADVAWTASGATVGSVTGGGTLVDTVATAGEDGAAASIVISGVQGDLGSDFRIGVTFLADGAVRTAALPGLGLVSSIQELEARIEQGLGLPEEALELHLVERGSDAYLRLKLGIGQCTDGFSDCPSTWTGGADPIETSLEFDLSEAAGLPDLVGLNTSGTLTVEHKAGGQLDVGIPVDPTGTAAPVVYGGTKAEVAADLDTSSLDLTANLGPLQAQVGVGTYVLDGTHDGSDDSAELTDSTVDFADLGGLVGATLENTGDADDGGDATSCVIGSASGSTLTCESGSGNLDFDAGEPYTVTVTGEGSAEVGAEVTLATSLGADDADPVDDFIGDLTLDLAPTDDFTGGCVPPLSLVDPVACATASLGVGTGGGDTQYLGEMVFGVGSNPVAVDAMVPASLADRLSAAILDWDLLLAALEELLDDLEAVLEEGAQDVELPIVGDALDAGADVAGAISDIVSALSGLQATLNGLATDAPFEDVESAIESELNSLDLLVGTANVTLLCAGGAACASGDELQDISDVRVQMTIGEGTSACRGSTDPETDCAGDPASFPFDLGIDGIPFGIQANVEARAGWQLSLDFGLSRNEGPYLGVGTAGDPAELSLGAEVGLGTDPDCATAGATFPGDDTAFDDYTADACVKGELGFLDILLQDSTADPTGVGLTTGINLTGDSEKLSFGELVAGGLSIEPTLSADANVDLRFRTGIVGDSEGSFPAVVGIFQASVSGDFLADDPWSSSAPSFSHLYLESGSFVGSLLGPALEEVQKVTKPLQPVIDTLKAPLPVLSDLAALVGEPPVRLLDLMKTQTGSEGLQLIDSIIQLVTLINALDDFSGGTVWVDLGTGDVDGGAFDIDMGQVGDSPPTPDRAGALVSLVDGNTDILGDIAGDAGLDTGDGGQSRPGTFGVAGLTFPFLEQPTELFGLLMSKDVTLVRYDAGVLEATAGFSYSFGPIMVGPIPITVTIGGSGTVRGRFVMGYDTYGLRQVIEGGSGLAIFDGVFIDDLDLDGRDVPEITLIGDVYADAGVDLLIVSAGVRGGLTMTTDLNLNDSPTPDGKLRIDEILDKLANPICLFDVSGRLEAYLALFVEIDLLLTSKEYVFELARVILLEFSGACDPPSPEPATPLDESGDDVLEINIGSSSLRDRRNIQTGEEEESVTVRQMDAAGKVLRVTMFGFSKDYVAPDDAWELVRANGGSENDEIFLEPGGSDTDADVVYPFTVPYDLDGGGGADDIRGGDGGGTMDGGPGNDVLEGGIGADIIDGGTENDRITGSLGDDQLDGEGGNDTVTGGPGSDRIVGDTGNDQLDGGPALREDALDELPGSVDTDALKDKADTIIGGPGSDTLTGGPAGDRLFGDSEHTIASLGFLSNPATPMPADAQTACDDATADTDAVDILSGGDGNDVLVGGPDADQLSGNLGNDLLCGNAGDDVLEGDDERTPVAEHGDDRIYGGPDDDTAFGRGGDDRLHGDAGKDLLLGDEGNDHLSGGPGADLLDGSSGADVAVGDGGTIPTDATAASAPTDVTRDESAGTDGSRDANCNLDPEAGDVFPDGASDTDDDDCLLGGDGNDALFGETGDDIVLGDAGSDHAEGNGGEDLVRGGADGDELLGGADSDELFGDSGDDRAQGNAGDDLVRGGIGDDSLIGGSRVAGANDGADVLHGDAGHDIVLGDNGDIVPSSGTDPIWGGPARSVTLHDVGGAATTSGGDVLNGNAGNDQMYGQGNGDDADDDGDGTVNEDAPDGIDDDDSGSEGEDGGGDILRGGAGDDYLEGNEGADHLIGGTDFDDLIGGSSTEGVSDGDDVIVGDTGRGLAGDDDVIAGDNATIVRNLSGSDVLQDPARSGPARVVALLDVAQAGGGASVAAGDDVIDAQGGEDRVYGGGGADTIDGGADDDVIEGNAGADTVNGGNGNDDIIGGSSAADGNIGTTSNGTGAADVGDTRLEGGNGVDVIAGDNARILRPTDGDSLWKPDVNREDAAIRDIQLFDVATASDPTAADDAGGGDTILGDDGSDVNGDGPDLLFGQTGSDTVDGHGGDDYIEGNDGPDTLSGGPEHDDLIGGSSAADGVIAGGSDGTATLDATDADWADGTGVRDVLHGNDGHDVLAGDNARITRLTADDDSFVGDPNRDLTATRDVLLFDVAATGAPGPATGAAGPDLLSGGDGKDRLYAQGSGDDVAGGPGGDIAEGNAGADLIDGGDGDDDLIGGSSSAADVIGDGTFEGPIGNGSSGQNAHDTGDTITGGGGHDAVAGDNARILRPVTPTFWILDEARSSVVRDVQLFDVQTMGGPDVPAAVSGGDLLLGQAGHDQVFGQGNGAEVDDDGDAGADFDPDEHSHGGVNEDPLDGVDNDRDGFTDEDGALVGAATWDGTAVVLDLTVPGAGDADAIFGGDDSDVLEGNHGADLVVGNAGQDDVIGGSSAGDGHILPGDHDDHVAPTDLADGHDALHGDDIGEFDTGGADVLVGDNGVIDRGDVGAAWQTLGQRDDSGDTLDPGNPFLDVIVRDTTIADTPEADGAYGSDWMAGGGGPDELVGQLGDDEQHGDWGDDALIGDLGKVNTVLSITEAERIFVQQPFLEAFLEPQGALVHNVELFTFLEGEGGEGRDLMLGEDGTDSLHGGPGDDVMNGDGDGTLTGALPSSVDDPNPGPDEDEDPNLDDADYLFGGDGDDDMWGGRGPDDLFGGYGDDEMDVFPRTFDVSYKGGPDEAIWFEVAAADVFQGLDYIYGGWDQDAMQADLQETGPRIADRLIDWSGAYNVYYVCEGAYGEGSITRTVAPQVIDFLQDLAEGRGAFDVTSKTSSGFREAAIVFTQDIKHNTNPVHPDHPGHFTCDGVE